MQYQQKFLEIISNPYQLDEQSLTVLQKLAAEYPYCQSVQILLAKNLQTFDRLDFEKQVNKASAYAIDRRKFQRYISDRDKPVVKISEPVIESPENQENPHPQAGVTDDVDAKSHPLTQVNIGTIGSPVVKVTEPADTVISPAKEITTQEPVSEVPAKSDVLTTDGVENRDEAEKKIKPVVTPPLELQEPTLQNNDDEKKILPSQLTENKEISGTNNSPVKTTPVSTPAFSLIEIVKRRLREIRQNSLNPKPHSEKKESSAVQPGPATQEKKSAPIARDKPAISEIADAVAPKNNVPDKTTVKDVTIQAMASAEPISGKEFEKAETAATSTKTDKIIPKADVVEAKAPRILPASEIKVVANHRFQPERAFTEHERLAQKPDISKLIDKFLKEEPRIQIKRDLPETQEDLSEASANENTLLVSETLAVVYQRQGKKEKALEIYEKLCLKYPEKSSYFAQKIIAINNEINN